MLKIVVIPREAVSRTSNPSGRPFPSSDIISIRAPSFSFFNDTVMRPFSPGKKACLKEFVIISLITSPSGIAESIESSVSAISKTTATLLFAAEL